MKNNVSQFSFIIEKQVIKKAQKGDMPSHEFIYRSFSDAVYHLAFSITNNVHVAEDILQNTFINVLNKVHNYRFKAPFGMWLRKITVNQTLMYIRSNTSKENSHTTITDNIVELRNDFNNNPGHSIEIEKSNVQLDLKYLLSQLPLHTRTVLWLKEVEGYTHSEIAKMMNKTESYSKSLVARTYETLRNRHSQNKNKKTTHLERS